MNHARNSPKGDISLSSRAWLTGLGLFGGPVRVLIECRGNPQCIAAMVRSPASSRTTKPVPPFQTSPGTALVAGGRRARKADATSSTDAFMVTRLHKVRLPGQAPSRSEIGRAHV